MNKNISVAQSNAETRYRFEAGTYGDKGDFMPSIACIKMTGKEEIYHFVLVRLGKRYKEEEQALAEATNDLNQAFKEKEQSDQQVAFELRNRGYLKVDDFNIVKEAESVH